MKILVLTVGGSSEPLVSSIRWSRPDALAFICSDDRGSSKGSFTLVESILAQAEVSRQGHEIVRIKAFDDANSCYLESLALLQRLRTEHSGAEIIADFTGGTKSMSAGLVLAALDTERVILGLQEGLRTDLDKVVSGTQFTRLSYSHMPLAHRQLKSVAYFFERFDYPAAMAVLEALLALPDLSADLAEPLQHQIVLARALNAWDRFDHGMAWNLLSPLRSQHVDLVMFLEAVAWSRRKLESQFEEAMSGRMGDKPKGHGYELVQDLVLNAERRASQGRYDDAVARLYRGLEMLAQARLWYSREVDTGNVDVNRLPQNLQEEYQRRAEKAGGKLQIGLRDSFELLMRIGQDPVGKVYSGQREQMRDFLSIRNSSLYAHGFSPITQSEYRKAKDFAEAFLKQAIQATLQSRDAPRMYADPVQFPQSSPGSIILPRGSANESN